MRHFAAVLGALLVLPFVLAPGSARAGPNMIAMIAGDVQTEFGTYHPIPVQFTPAVPTFVVAPDFSNICNFNDMNRTFTARDSMLLLTNHFTVKWSAIDFWVCGSPEKGGAMQMHYIYNDCTHRNIPIFVTSDAVLHIYHVLFDAFLAQIEEERFVGMIGALTDALIAKANEQYAAASDSLAVDAALRNLGYLWVAKRLIGAEPVAVPSSVSTMVEAELALIEAHEGTADRLVFGPGAPPLDYSQFVPRGHYTKSETLKRYFKTMMWYGLTAFTMEPQLYGDVARRHTVQALLLVQALYAVEHEGSPLFDVWNGVYDPTVFFVGKTDDPNVRDYLRIAEQVYGAGFPGQPPDALADAGLLESFMVEAQKLPPPKIANWDADLGIPYKAFRFMGQRFIPDSYMFANLVNPFIPGRSFPKGLDVLAILGSDRAYEILDAVYGDTRLPGYPERIEAFRTEFESAPVESWAQNLYWNWLYSLMPLFYDKGLGYPQFMQNTAWRDRELIAALGSWTQLRHDTILYAKQSGGLICEPPGPPRSYVEPNPHLYGRLASLTQFTRDGLESRGLLLEGFRERLDLFQLLLVFLKDISVRELENTPLTDEDYANIYTFGDVMEQLLTFDVNPERPWEKKLDDMAIVADVHTDFTTQKVLEEGVGYPLEVFVIVNEGDYVRTTRGAIFSYYEFEHPMDDRLTDERWREMLQWGQPPDMPVWTAGFMDVAAPRGWLTTNESRSIWSHEFDPTSATHAEKRGVILHPNRPNPFNPETFIRYEVPYASRVRLEIYDLLGRSIRVLYDREAGAGTHSLKWDGRDEVGRPAASGVYVVRLVVGQTLRVRRVTLMR